MRTITLLLFLFTTITTNAQQQLLSAAHSAELSQGETYSWALGDVFANGQSGSQVTVVVTGTEFFKPFQSQLDIKVLGNPTNEQIDLQFSKPTAIRYRLLNANGQLVKTGFYDSPQLSCRISITDLPAQVYFLQIATLNGRSGNTLRIVKQ